MWRGLESFAKEKIETEIGNGRPMDNGLATETDLFLLARFWYRKIVPLNGCYSLKSISVGKDSNIIITQTD